jgi:hypothetical protein
MFSLRNGRESSSSRVNDSNFSQPSCVKAVLWKTVPLPHTIFYTERADSLSQFICNQDDVKIGHRLILTQKARAALATINCQSLQTGGGWRAYLPWNSCLARGNQGGSLQQQSVTIAVATLMTYRKTKLWNRGVTGMHTSARNQAIVWGCLIIAMLANVAGYVWNLYSQIRLFDEFLHAFTAFALTLPVALLLYRVILTGADTRPLLFVLTVAGLGLAIGAVWEIAEWVYDQIVPGNAILGKNDTIIDLIVDAAGSIMAGIVSVTMVNKQ